MQNTPNGVLGVVSINVRSSGSNIDRGTKMRSLNTKEIMVVGGGSDLIPEGYGGPAWFPPPIVVTPPLPQQFELREYLSPDDIWQLVQ